MAYNPTESFVVAQKIEATSTTKKHDLGTLVRAVDPTYGVGEFIYLLGVASTIVGSAVSYSPSTYQTALAPVGDSVPRPIAFAMSANVAGQFGWYQIGGTATAAKAATICCVVGAAVAVATIGLVRKTLSLKEVVGAVVAATASAKTGVITVLLSVQRPTMQGRIT
jgi:hypothetical protein